MYSKFIGDKAGNDWLLTDNYLGMIHPGKKEPDSYFTETKGKFGGMNRAFYAVQERDKDICFASDRGRIWSYQKDSGEFTLIELPTKRADHFHSPRCTGRFCNYYRFGWFLYL